MSEFVRIGNKGYKIVYGGVLHQLSSVPSGLGEIVGGCGSCAREATAAVINRDCLIVEQILPVYHHVFGMADLGTKGAGCFHDTGAKVSAETAAGLSLSLLDLIVVPFD